MNEREDEEQDKPLSSEALKREEWRGERPLPSGDRNRDPADEGNRDGPDPLAGTMLPPD